MANSKWMATVASIWIQCTGGASYAFGVYSDVLKSSQGYSQTTLDTVSVFKDIGANIGVLSGLLYHAATSSSTPWLPSFRSKLAVVYIAGALQCFLGNFFIWLFIAGNFRPPVAVMCIFMFMASHAQTFFNTANVVVAVKNFPDYGGTTVGIMKGFLGLSGAILIQINLTLFAGNPTAFIMMLAVIPTFFSLILMRLVHENPSKTTHDKHHLNKFSLIALAIAFYLLIILILQNQFDFSTCNHILTTIPLLILILSPYLIAHTAQQMEQQDTASTSTLTDVLIAVATSKSDQGGPPGVEMNLLQAMSTLNFWLLFLAMVCAMGSGLATINNITQIAQSIDYSTVRISLILSLWSIWNFLGRFCGGYVSDLFLHNCGWPRPLFISLTLFAMMFGHLTIAVGWSLYLGTFIVGVCYGSQWSLMPTITSEIFGVKHMGTIFNTIAAANPVGSYIFSVLVIGSIYDSHAKGKGGECSGIHCFKLSFFVLAAVCGFGFFVSFVLYLRTKGFYATVSEKPSKAVDDVEVKG